MARKQVCVDMDDLCDNVKLQHYEGKTIYLLDWLQAWKDRTPNLKLTLYTIPQRTSDATIRIFKLNYPWVALAPHGWEHTRGECLGWTQDEAVGRIKAAKSRGIDAPIFRAPAWLLDGDTYEACRELGYVVASHSIYRIASTGVREYVYNMPNGMAAKTIPIHGHLTPVSGNWIYDMHRDGLLDFDKDDPFVWPWEVAVEVQESVSPKLRQRTEEEMREWL